MKIHVRGKTYDSVREASEKLRVAPNTIYAALHRGTIDNVGRGQGRAPKESPRRGGRPPKPFAMGGVIWGSMSEASLALGKSKTYVAVTLKRGGPVAKGRLLQLVMQYKARQEHKAFKDLDKQMSRGIDKRHTGGG
jgi:hypothetical protein